MKVQDDYYSIGEKTYYPYKPYYSSVDKEKKKYLFGLPDIYDYSSYSIFLRYKSDVNNVSRVYSQSLKCELRIKGYSLFLTHTTDNKEAVYTNKEYTKTLVSGDYYINKLKLSIKSIIDTDKDKKWGTNTIPPHIMEDFIGDKIN